MADGLAMQGDAPARPCEGAQILARVLLKAECVFVTGEENRAMIEKMHMKWAATVEEALSIAEERLGPNVTIAVIPDGVGVIVG